MEVLLQLCRRCKQEQCLEIVSGVLDTLSSTPAGINALVHHYAPERVATVARESRQIICALRWSGAPASCKGRPGSCC